MPQDLRTHLQLYLERLERLGPRPPYGDGAEDSEISHWERERSQILAIIGDLTIQWLGRQEKESP